MWSLVNQLAPQPVVIATVIRVQGSVPRQVGARMMIWQGGQTHGTIGGGAGEAKVIRQALRVLETGENQRVTIDLNQREGICGGTMQVWLERWLDVALAQEICDRFTAGQSATLATPLTAHQSSYLIPQPVSIPNTFVETLQPPPILLIVGAGHVGEQLAKVADLLEFRVMVQDDRPDWANRERFPQAAGIFQGAIASVMGQFASHTHLYVALVTRGYQYDLAALEAILPYDCAYIGMIGSQRRVQQVYRELVAAGISPDRLAKIHAPIGLEIGAQTPAEIAVSIGAELVQVRATVDYG